MAETQTPAPGPPADGDDQAQGVNWGRVLDVAGLVAAGVLVVILIDIVSDGRFLSARLWRRGGPGPADQEGPPDEPPPAG